MTTFVGNMNAISYENIVTNSSSFGKLYVPVSKSALLYSHFEHVQGVTAQAGQAGVSISKLRILNSMIEHVSTKGELPSDLGKLSDSDIDNLIKNYSQQIKKVAQSPYKLAGVQPFAGEIFSIQA